MAIRQTLERKKKAIRNSIINPWIDNYINLLQEIVIRQDKALEAIIDADMPAWSLEQERIGNIAVVRTTQSEVLDMIKQHDEQEFK